MVRFYYTLPKLPDTYLPNSVNQIVVHIFDKQINVRYSHKQTIRYTFDIQISKKKTKLINRVGDLYKRVYKTLRSERPATGDCRMCR